jgi:hypothetical protein
MGGRRNHGMALHQTTLFLLKRERDEGSRRGYLGHFWFTSRGPFVAALCSSWLLTDGPSDQLHGNAPRAGIIPA